MSGERSRGTSQYRMLRLRGVVSRYNKFTEADGGKVHMQQYTAHTNSKLDIPSHSQDHPYCKPKEVKQQTESPFVLAIVTPLMARVHKLVQQAGEMVFCDATASLDRLNTPVFIISAATAAGALPLAVLMTSREDVSTITEAFRILKTILPPDAFFRRGPQLEPMGIMTDNSASERQSLRATWPQATFKLRDEWCVCLRKDFMTRGNNTNNYSEEVIRITKDIIF